MSKDFLIKAAEYTIRWGFYLLFFLVPLLFTPWNYELFEYNKMMLVYGLTGLIASAFLIKTTAVGKFKIEKTPFDIPLLLFLASQILSTMFSIDRHTSLYGYYSRFHGGLASSICYLALFYIFTTEYKTRKEMVIKSIYAGIGSGFFVSLYAVAQRMGIDKTIWVQDVQNRVFSTLGQPNWLAAYFAVLILLLAGLFFREKSLKRLLYLILIDLFYIVIIFTKSRSGFAALWMGLVLYLALFLFFAFFTKKTNKIRPGLKNLAIIFIILLFSSFIWGTTFSQLEKYTLNGLLAQKSAPAANTQPPSTGTVLETGGTESGDIRKIVWKGAVDIVKHYPLFGSGVETFAYSYYQFRPAEHNLTSEWDFLYNKAHNEYLNFAATTGVIGLLTYLSIIIAFIIWSFLKIKNHDERHLLLAILAGYLTILITNFFGFSVVVIGIYFFLLPAFSYVLSQKPENTANIVRHKYKYSELTLTQKSLVYLWLIILAMLFFSLAQTWRADTFFSQGHQLLRSQNYLEAYNAFQTAIKINPGEPLFKDEYVTAVSGLSILAKQQKEDDLSNKLKAEAMSLSQQLTDQYPANVTYAKTRTKALYTLSELDQNLLPDALSAILAAWKLSPNDAKIVYNAGLLYAKLGQTQKAIETLKIARDLKTDYYEPRYALALFYEQTNEKEEAKKEAEYILGKIRPDDPSVKELLKKL